MRPIRETTVAKRFRDLLNNCRVYHFHDTSPTARVRQYCYIGDNRWLMPDAGNLAAVLYRLKTQNGGTAYSRIVKTIRMIAPFFDDFELAPSAENGRDIILNWRHVESSQIFRPPSAFRRNLAGDVSGNVAAAARGRIARISLSSMSRNLGCILTP